MSPILKIIHQWIVQLCQIDAKNDIADKKYQGKQLEKIEIEKKGSRTLLPFYVLVPEFGRKKFFLGENKNCFQVLLHRSIWHTYNYENQ